MANSVQQEKLKAITVQIQNDNTATPINDAGNYNSYNWMVPATDFTLSPSRGTRRISRAGTMDGWAGEMCGVSGSWGWSASITSEIHAQKDSNGDIIPTPYWLRMLLACGHEAVYTEGLGEFEVTLKPSHKQIVPILKTDFETLTDGDVLPPSLMTIREIHYANDENDSYYMEAMECTGSASFNFSVGEVATISCEFVGTQKDDSLVNLNDLVKPFTKQQLATSKGYQPGVACSPMVVLGISVLLDDEPPTALRSIEFNSNASTPDVPRETYGGFAMSPVLWDEGATITVDLAAEAVYTSASSAKNVLEKFQNASKIEFYVSCKLDGGDAMFKINVPNAQFEEVSFANTDGYRSLNLNLRVVRNPGQESSYTISYSADLPA